MPRSADHVDSNPSGSQSCALSRQPCQSVVPVTSDRRVLHLKRKLLAQPWNKQKKPEFWPIDARSSICIPFILAAVPPLTATTPLCKRRSEEYTSID
eukprot:2478659-Rhodomonas_salina.3